MHPVLPRAIDLKEPYWYVVSEKNLEEFLSRVEKEEGSVVFFAMSVPLYLFIICSTSKGTEFLSNAILSIGLFFKFVSTTVAGSFPFSGLIVFSKLYTACFKAVLTGVGESPSFGALGFITTC